MLDYISRRQTEILHRVLRTSHTRNCWCFFLELSPSRHTFLCCSVVGSFVEAICQPAGKVSFNESALSLWQFLCSGVNLSAARWAYKSHWWHIWGTLGIVPPFLTCDLIPLSAIAATHKPLTPAALARWCRLGGKWGCDLLIQGKVQLLCWKQLHFGGSVRWGEWNSSSEMVSLDPVELCSEKRLQIWGT